MTKQASNGDCETLTRALGRGGLPGWMFVVMGAILFAQFIWRAEDSLTRESPTWDENMHINYGINFLRIGPSFPAGDHPYPFVALLTLPLALSQPGPGAITGVWENPKTGGYAEIRAVENPSNLFPARRMNVAVAALGLALASLWIGRRYGASIGLGFAALGTLDPAWMASARYVTTDIAQGLAFLLGSLALVRLRETGRIGALVVAGLALGLGLTAKASGLILIPCAFVFGLLPAVGTKGESRPQRFKRAVTWSVTVGAIGLSAYGSLFFIHAALGLLPWGSGVDHLRAALTKFMEIRGTPHGTFLLGAFFPFGTRLYFPALMAAKTPLALIAIVLTPLLAKKARVWVRRHADLLIVPVVFLTTAIASGLNLGYRHLTPVFPAFWLLGAVGMAGLASRFRFGRWAGPAATALLAMEIWLAHPHYLQFTNAAFGGVDNAWNVAVDSASDWGQDLPLLHSWLARNPPHEGPVHLAYFGTAD
ncbi:MAG: hypothetical protein GXP54_02290, partial [Deltaproteobacteria bacterium]|nr:hypothetical protein [Deltaproteobacteria bacterium]